MAAGVHTTCSEGSSSLRRVLSCRLASDFSKCSTWQRERGATRWEGESGAGRNEGPRGVRVWHAGRRGRCGAVGRVGAVGTVGAVRRGGGGVGRGNAEAWEGCGVCGGGRGGGGVCGPKLGGVEAEGVWESALSGC